MVRRFTLVELMVVVAIILVLAAIAIPVMRKYTTETRFVEAKLSFDGIQTTSTGLVESGELPATLDAQTNPDFNPGKTARAWETTDPDWSRLGWRPDGDIRCSYWYHYLLAAGEQEFGILCDVDGDNDWVWIDASQYDNRWMNETFVDCGTSPFYQTTLGLGERPEWPAYDFPCR